MSKITITPLRQQTGVYGTVRAHQPVELDADLAKDLLKSGLWVKGLTDEAKRFQESVKQRRADEAAKAAEKAKADADAEAAAQAAADAEAKAKAEADAKAKADAEADAKAKADADKKAAK